MASLSHDKGERYRIQFIDADGKRRTIRLGALPRAQAEQIKRHVEALVSAQVSGEPIRRQTGLWLAEDVGEVLRGRMEAAGLVEPVEPVEASNTPCLAEWLDRYIGMRTDVKPLTTRNMKQARDTLVEYFGPDRPIDTITPLDAEAFAAWMIGPRGLAKATAARRLKRAKQFFSAAVKGKILAESPFTDIKAGKAKNRDRLRFIEAADVLAVMEACPDPQWRAIFALCRFGGFRCPTEVLRLTWADVDWERRRLTVHATKTEHHEGGGVRVLPMFPEIEAPLEECFAQAEPGGDPHVITRYRTTNSNLRTQARRIIKGAGLAPWPRTFSNLRASRATELADRFPGHVCAAWLGHSEAVADLHYRQVNESHFKKALADKAAQNAAQSTTQKAGNGGKSRGRAKSRENAERPETPFISGHFRPFPLQVLENKGLTTTPTGTRTPVSRMRT